MTTELIDDMTEAEWQDCYYVYRALRNGVCPNCGYHGKPETFECATLGTHCPECCYRLAKEEIHTILALSKRLLKRRTDAVVKMREINNFVHRN